jgi:hypothetical protein
MGAWRYSMWVLVRRPDGKTEEREFPAGVYIEIGDVLSDGSIVMDVPYPDDIDDDMVALDLYDD